MRIFQFDWHQIVEGVAIAVSATGVRSYSPQRIGRLAFYVDPTTPANRDGEKVIISRASLGTAADEYWLIPERNGDDRRALLFIHRAPSTWFDVEVTGNYSSVGNSYGGVSDEEIVILEPEASFHATRPAHRFEKPNFLAKWNGESFEISEMGPMTGAGGAGALTIL